MADFQANTTGLFHNCGLDVNCIESILVIDHPHGPAELLMDTAARLSPQPICVLLSSCLVEARELLREVQFKAIVVGLSEKQPEGTLSLLDELDSSTSPVLVVIEKPSQASLLRNHDHFKVVQLPRRAADLKIVFTDLVAHYLLNV